MTPGARVSAAIEILDSMADGLAAEQALTRWARNSRFAGSKDRAAVRDHVFDVLRNRAMARHLGQGETGRALMIGLLRLQGADLAAIFNAQGHAPTELSADEEVAPPAPEPATTWNLPEWLITAFQEALGEGAQQAAQLLQSRAPICLRVNLQRTTVAQAQTQLSQEGIETRQTDVADTALIVTGGARKIRNSESYLKGLVELQDAASQAIVAGLPAVQTALDYCAGGGGKALALAMNSGTSVFAHDISPRRMVDLPARAARAGAVITLLETDALASHAPFDLVLCDAPCSGSGAWRRAAEGKWTLTEARLTELNATQDQILEDAKALIGPSGTLAYATCSVLTSENEDRISAFLARNPGWECALQRRFDLDEDADGFFVAHLTRAN